MPLAQTGSAGLDAVEEVVKHIFVELIDVIVFGVPITYGPDAISVGIVAFSEYVNSDDTVLSFARLLLKHPLALYFVVAALIVGLLLPLYIEPLEQDVALEHTGSDGALPFVVNVKQIFVALIDENVSCVPVT